jgi:hypothetical protein
MNFQTDLPVAAFTAWIALSRPPTMTRALPVVPSAASSAADE